MRLKAEVEGLSLLFPRGQSTLAPGQDATVRRVSAALTELNELMKARGQQAAFEIVGNTDADGSDAENGPLSRRRAEVVAAALPMARLDAMHIVPRGVGAARRRSRSAGRRGQVRNRRVSFVSFAAGPGRRAG